MFALAVFDMAARRIVLARDRFGEKPLYYGYSGGSFIFASELKALRSTPDFDSSIDRGALAAFMRLGYVPAPHSIYGFMRKLSNASWLELTQGQVAARAWPEPKCYWSASEAALSGDKEPLDIDDEGAIGLLERVLATAVKDQMISDVSLGAFLSGGIDSSTIVALMQAQSNRPVCTFSIGFREEAYDESARARDVARHLGTEHTQLIVTAEDALRLIPEVPAVYDEPFADSSQLPTLLVAMPRVPR